jgi:hypothetical protein
MGISGRSALGPTFTSLLILGIVAAALGTAPRALGQGAASDPPNVPLPAHASDTPSQKASAPSASVNTEAITQHLNQERSPQQDRKSRPVIGDEVDWGPRQLAEQVAAQESPPQ